MSATNEYAIGQRRWAIADGYIPSRSVGPQPQMRSHGTLSLLNAGEEPADVELLVYFSDREPAGPYRVRVDARRTCHVRWESLDRPEPVPKDTDFACVVVSSVPIVVQHTRLDSRQSENALMTTLAYAG